MTTGWLRRNNTSVEIISQNHHLHDKFESHQSGPALPKTPRLTDHITAYHDSKVEDAFLGCKIYTEKNHILKNSDVMLKKKKN